MTIERLAFDRASVRKIDDVGRLQVERSNISKANVCPYYGREIPGYKELGLEPDKIYRLWRHPDELKKAASTFNNIPILCVHTPDFPGDPPREYRVGTTHSNCEFSGTYLSVGLSIWDNSAIAGIETDEQRELSASYQYVADMTPGVTPDGENYDGIMRDLIANHIALVENGRAGSDVLVADSLPLELLTMAKKTAKKIEQLKPFLAQDADIDTVTKILAMDEEDDKEKEKPAEDEEDDDKDKDKEKPAEDEEDDDKVTKTAMDSAIRIATEKVKKAAARNFRLIREAEIAVRPLIGDVVAMDSADEIYKMALEQSDIDIKNVHPSAYPAMVRMAVSQKKSSQPARQHLANDAALVSDFHQAFPEAGKLKRG